ncbi:hypothetical protein SEUCBS139899_002138 [Sporothrix eucalyptigena]|uniref:Uncharacterized protein n=1 Tax=Sporothrix eucalyptigena TaxID=1812306 RepID=A0ABP0B4F3_9PEZI
MGCFKTLFRLSLRHKESEKVSQPDEPVYGFWPRDSTLRHPVWASRDPDEHVPLLVSASQFPPSSGARPLGQVMEPRGERNPETARAYVAALYEDLLRGPRCIHRPSFDELSTGEPPIHELPIHEPPPSNPPCWERVLGCLECIIALCPVTCQFCGHILCPCCIHTPVPAEPEIDVTTESAVNGTAVHRPPTPGVISAPRDDGPAEPNHPSLEAVSAPQTNGDAEHPLPTPGGDSVNTA